MTALCLAVVSVASAAAGWLGGGNRVGALDAGLWRESEWISAADAPVFSGKMQSDSRAADGVSWFTRELEDEGAVESAVWMTSGLGVYELYVNGRRVGRDSLKPGFTHVRKCRRSFTYDVTDCFKKRKGEKNFLAAEVSAGWWRDKIVNFAGKKSAFRSVLRIKYADGSVKVVGTRAGEWMAGVGGPVTHAAIFDGEEYDERIERPCFGSASFRPAEPNVEFKGEILPSEGGEVCLRFDKMLRPVSAYVWKGIDGADAEKKVFGRVHRLRDIKIRCEDGGAVFEGCTLAKGETLVVDFGQNCAAVPGFVFKAAEGTVLTCLPAEMLNDGNGEHSRGNDGPAGSAYRKNLRCPGSGMRAVYTFGSPKGSDKTVMYLPTHTFFGFRYVSVTATADVDIGYMVSIPVSSIAREMEIGRLETGDAAVNKLVSNVYWGQLSNYLSVPTDCPQRNERLGWTADTQVFCEAGAFNADTRAFFHKWMRDMRDTQDAKGGFPGVAPFGQYGSDTMMRLGWADAGVIVPYKVWLMFGDKSIVDENWDAMERFMARAAETKYRTENLPECRNYQWNDWLSLTKFESCPYKPEYDAFEKGSDGKRRPKADALLYWNYLGGCYWLWDARMTAEMAAATGRDASKYLKMADEAKAYMRAEFFAEPDGMIVPVLRGMQTPALFALKLGLVEGEAKERTLADLKGSFAANGGTFHTGFLGTSILMDTLIENNLDTLAYDLLLNHSFPGWLYSVDQGATTIWERWNSYTKDNGFGPVGMNSFNHYAYGSVLAWIYKTAAGIAADPKAPGFKNIVMAPKPDRRLGFVKAEYRSAAGLVKSHWRYEGEKWVWEFTVPDGATADVTVPGESTSRHYGSGTYTIERRGTATAL